MSGGDYLAAAYLVFVAVVVLYVALIGLKLARLDRELEALAQRARISREGAERTATTPARRSSDRALARGGEGRVG